MLVKKNITTVFMIIMLFTSIFFLGNQNYFIKSNSQLIHNGTGTITKAQLQEKSTFQLNGDWSFYPNVLIAPDEEMDTYEDQRIVLEVPSNWKYSVEPNHEGLTVGTYHAKIKVPVDQQYGLYIQTIRQANRIFINNEEVGGIGNPTESLKEFQSENDDRYTVFAQSENRTLDIVIHVTNKNYSEAGILYPVEFGTKDAIQKYYRTKVLTAAFISIGYMVFGVIYVISFSQNRKRKEELFFGFFAILFGLYMSFINQKVFFLIYPTITTSNQIRLQLGVLPLVVACLTYFIYCMYPQFVKKKALYIINFFLGILFLRYGIFEGYATNAAHHQIPGMTNSMTDFQA